MTLRTSPPKNTSPLKNISPPKRFLTVSKAAELLGVSVKTLHNWDRSGKLKAHRHPINGYRLYDVMQLEPLINTLSGPSAPAIVASPKAG